MADTLDVRDFEARLRRLDALLREAEGSADPAAWARLQEIVQAVLDLHRAGLERLLGRVPDPGEAARDGVIGGLLLLHGLHPLGLEERIREALDGVRPYLRSHGGDVELLGLADGVVRLRLDGNCHHCPSSAVTMQQTVEEAIYGKAPEVTAVEVEGLPAGPPGPDGARIALPVL